MIELNVRERLQALMKERGWSVYRLAKEADVPITTVRNIFKLETDPTLSTLESLCKGFGLSLADFFDATIDTELSEEERRVIRRWQQCDEKEKHLLLELMDALHKES